MTEVVTPIGRAQRATLEDAALARLRTSFRGALLRSGEEGYDEARRVWNGAIDRHPALIARCAGADDVVAAVRFAGEHELLVSVRGGGHAVAGHAVCDGGLMIDLSATKAVRVDPQARTARAAGGVLLGELDRATQRFGLAVPSGIVSHTGIGGLTLGGGLGHLMRKHGLTVDNLLGVELVTAEGERMRVDAASEPELFWGLRGGGGNFGIATAFEYRLHPVGPMMLGGPIFWPIADAPEVLRFVRDFGPQAPDELSIVMFGRLAPPGPLVPPEQDGKPVLGLVPVWAGDPAEGLRAIAPLRRIGRPIAEMVRPLPFLFLQSMVDAGTSTACTTTGDPSGSRSSPTMSSTCSPGWSRASPRPCPTSPGSPWAAPPAGSTPVPRRSASAGMASSSASSPAGRRPTPPLSATSPGSAKAGRTSARTAPGCTRTSSPTRAAPASRTPTASGCNGSPR
jgi:hypothetical protein